MKTSTRIKILKVFGCKGKTFHVVSGVEILRRALGMKCPYCGAEIEDITDTPIGVEFTKASGYDIRPPNIMRVLPPPSGLSI